MNKFRRLPHERVKHRTTLPYTPKTNGMVERMNGLTKENTVKKNRDVTLQEMLDDLLDALPGWFVRYNFCRKNRRNNFCRKNRRNNFCRKNRRNNFCRKNRRIGGKRPYEAVLAWHKKAPSLFIQEIVHPGNCSSRNLPRSLLCVMAVHNDMKLDN